MRDLGIARLFVAATFIVLVFGGDPSILESARVWAAKQAGACHQPTEASPTWAGGE